jgi:hypothetical protein
VDIALISASQLIGAGFEVILGTPPRLKDPFGTSLPLRTSNGLYLIDGQALASCSPHGQATPESGITHRGHCGYDFVSAFLQGDLEPGEQIACRPPPGYETLGDDGNHKIWRVLKPIYGMQQGGRRWQRSLFPWFKALGFRQCEADNCVFVMTATGDALYVGCYVDDLYILYLQDGADSLYAAFTRELTQRWEVEDEGEVTDLLNIEISRQGASITLRQTAYIDKLTKEWFPHAPPSQ